MKKMKVAIIGQGRSGRDIHGLFYKSEQNDFVEVKAVVDADSQRRERALSEYPGCEVYECYEDLFGKEFDLVVNASYSENHYPITKVLLEHGFNVLCEKPFARTVYECNDLIRIAKKNNCILSVFHQSNTSPFIEEVKKVIESKKIGDILQISLRYNGLSRRWDWQTLQYKVAGNLYNTGPHPVGIAVELLGNDENIRLEYSKLGRALLSGDAEDYAKIILSAPGKPVVDIETNSTDAYCDYNLKLQGTRGTYKCTINDYKMKYIIEGENPEQPVQHEFIADENGYPIYCKEDLITHEEEGKFDGNPFDKGVENIYRNLYGAIFEGKELMVKPSLAAKVIAIMQTVHGQNPMEVQY